MGMCGMSPKEIRLAVLVVVIVTAHTTVSWFEEALFKKMGFNEPFFMIGYMCLMYAVCHIIAAPFFLKEHPSMLDFSRDIFAKNMHKSLLALCISYAGSNSISKMALGFVSIPTQIVFKSCKLVAVMLGSGCIMGKSYSWFDYGVAMCLVLGMICFAGADIFSGAGEEMKSVNVNTIIGVVLLIGALFCDSVLGNLQEKVQKGGLCDEIQLMYVQSLSGFVFLFAFAGATGELSVAINKCYTNITILWYLSAWAALNMFGIVLMLKVAGEFNAVTAVLTSSARKFLSLIVSYVFFPKPIILAHGAGLLFVFGAIFAHTWHKQKKKKVTAPPVDMGAYPADDEQDEEKGLIATKTSPPISTTVPFSPSPARRPHREGSLGGGSGMLPPPLLVVENERRPSQGAPTSGGLAQHILRMSLETGDHKHGA